MSQTPDQTTADSQRTASGSPANTLDNLATEDRAFPPSPDFAANANLTAEAYDRAAADPEAFWAEQAQRLSWVTPFTQVLDWTDAPHAKWFADGHAERRLQLRGPARRGRLRR